MAARGSELSDLWHCAARAKIDSTAKGRPQGGADLILHAVRDGCPSAVGRVIHWKVSEGFVGLVAQSGGGFEVFSVVTGSKGEVSGAKWSHLQPSVLIVSGENVVFRRIDGEFHIFSEF